MRPTGGRASPSRAASTPCAFAPHLLEAGTDLHTIQRRWPPADEFLHRFPLHVVPDGFVRIRQFGLLATPTRAATLARCRALLAPPVPPTPAPPESARAVMLRVTGIDIELYPVCQLGRLRLIEILAPTRGRARVLPAWDPS